MSATFETHRFLLRPREPADYDACLAMDRDPTVVRYVAKPWSNAEEHVTFLRRRIAEAFPAGLGYWSILPKDQKDDFLGWVMLCPTSVARGGIEIGWRLKRAAWGRGIATEAAQPILAQGVATAKLEQVVADIHPDNLGSMRVAEKLGLRFAGMVDYDGEPARRYRITREMYEKVPVGVQRNSKKTT